MAIEITVNGNLQLFEGECTIDFFLASLELQTRKAIAIALNGEVIQREDYSHTEISSGDSLEIVRAIGGG
jgi:thiamine biosynthesis protein ThiS